MKHLDIIRSRGLSYRQDHPAYVRRDDVPMIDLTPSPIEKEVSTLADDILGALVITGLGLGGLYLLFGFTVS